MLRLKQNKIVIGITGGLGSGKSTVARMLVSCGAELIDADSIAHKCIKRATPAYKEIVAVFGKGILKRNKEIDRGKLAGAVFRDRSLLSRLNKIVHPAVIGEIKSRIGLSRRKFILLDAPLLLEAGLKRLVDVLLVVNITRKEQVSRLRHKTRLPKKDILNRINLQIPLPRKIRLADFVIDNNGTLRETRRQVKEIWLSLAGGKKSPLGIIFETRNSGKIRSLGLWPRDDLRIRYSRQIRR